MIEQRLHRKRSAEEFCCSSLACGANIRRRGLSLQQNDWYGLYALIRTRPHASREGRSVARWRSPIANDNISRSLAQFVEARIKTIGGNSSTLAEIPTHIQPCLPRSEMLPHRRGAPAVGVYRLWRDLGYAIGALLAGITADLFGLPAAILLVAALTFASGAIAAVRMTETLKQGDLP